MRIYISIKINKINYVKLSLYCMLKKLAFHIDLMFVSYYLFYLYNHENYLKVFNFHFKLIYI